MHVMFEASKNKTFVGVTLRASHLLHLSQYACHTATATFHKQHELSTKGKPFS